MLGHTLLRRLSSGFEVVGTFRNEVPEVLRGFHFLTGVEAERLDTVSAAVARTQPDAVVNCIGVIKQHNPSRMELVHVNALFPHQLSRICDSAGARLIHFSTDCVFSGLTGNYREDSKPDPVDDYGRSKLLGEMESGALTIRTSFVGREVGSSRSLVEWLYSQRGGRIRGFRKAVYSGLTTFETARVVSRVLTDLRDLTGVWHVSSDPISKFDLLSMINREADLNIEIEPDETFCCDRTLESSRFRKKVPYLCPEWSVMVRELVKEGQWYDS